MKLRGRDFTGQDLCGVDFRGCDLTDARFIDCLLVLTRFDKANLTGASFRGAQMGLSKRRSAFLLACFMIATAIGVYCSLSVLVSAAELPATFDDTRFQWAGTAGFVAALLACWHSKRSFALLVIGGGISSLVFVAAAYASDRLGFDALAPYCWCLAILSVAAACWGIAGALGALGAKIIFSHSGVGTLLGIGAGLLFVAISRQTLLHPLLITLLVSLAAIRLYSDPDESESLFDKCESLIDRWGEFDLEFSWQRSATRNRFGRWARTTFSGADLSDADFEGAGVSGGDFSQAKCARTRWRDCVGIEDAWFGEASNWESPLSNQFIRNLVAAGKGEAADLRFQQLNDLFLGGTHMNNADLSNSNLEGTVLTGADLRSTRLVSSTLSKANLAGADLRGADLSSARSFGTTFDGVDLTGACLQDWMFDSTASFRGAKCGYFLLAGGKSRYPVEGVQELSACAFEELMRRVQGVIEKLPSDDGKSCTFSEVLEWIRVIEPVEPGRPKGAETAFAGGVPLDDRIPSDEDKQRPEPAHISVSEPLLSIGAPQASVNSRAAETTSGGTVFIVHGHDVGLRDAVRLLISELQLRSIVLEDQPERGRTVIEKFLDHSKGIGFAVVLLTPDDMGKSIREDAYQPRARQNVIFELGFFIGSLGQARVCALYKEGVEIPSDYHGVLFIKADENRAWRLKLAREFHAAGLPIDLSNLL